ncbi:glycosyltransferase [Rhodococcus sp. NPDC060090]|uniref:glycosyltransferase n=1 Tax=Rhodococcus sp. NPDC060090 TaxID=3347056 RepID=UPI0036651F0C
MTMQRGAPRVRESTSGKYVLYLAVVPVYRDACVRELMVRHGEDITIFAGEQHLDRTVRTGLPVDIVQRVKNFGLAGDRVLLQVGNWRDAINAEVTVIDLNPRSLTAWIIAGLRRLVKRRTLAWGHLHPRSGPESRTAPLRVLLRKFTDGTILYGYDSVVPARAELPDIPVWVAPNSLYRARDIETRDEDRRGILYVGRLEQAKNVHLLVDAFADSKLWCEGMFLQIVGFGSLEEEILRTATLRGIRDHVRFFGKVHDVSALGDIYAETLFSVSPGYVGLSLTQSLGFGVPVLYAQDAPHSPEIELQRFGGMESFTPVSVGGLAKEMVAYTRKLAASPVDRERLSRQVRGTYSAEGMAQGIWDALTNKPSELGPDGWPIREDSN